MVRPVNNSPPPRRGRRSALPRSQKGFVLFVVLIIGVAAGLAAMSLVTTRGGAQVAAIHSELGDRSQAYAEAGMQRAIFYLNDVLGNFGDFDAALDTNLDKDCNGGADLAPASTDARPDTGAADSDVLVEWSDGTEEVIDGKYYSCVSIPATAAPTGARGPQTGGRYCVRFEDDDDDAVATDLWRDNTGNSEAFVSGEPVCDSGGCLEGPAGVETTCPNNNAGQNNPLRDRNRAIWVVSIGIFPDVDFDDATHRTTIRRMHMAPRLPTMAGLSVKGNVVTGSGSSTWYACSDVASVAIDGHAQGHAAANVCASGYSRAHSWTNFSECEDLSVCENIAFGDGVDIEPLSGALETPGPRLDDLPDPWTNANEWVDFDRPCVFWVDNGASATAGQTLTGGNNSLWVWDSAASRGPSGARCGTYETVAAQDAPMPGPPNPAASPTGAAACTTTSDPACWAGCWTPLLFMDSGTPGPIVPTTWALSATAAALPAYMIPPLSNCYQPLWRTGNDPSQGETDGDVVLERALTPGVCAWRPNDREGFYHVCSDPQYCYQWGHEINSHGISTASDPLNQRLTLAGISNFPPATELRKPAWQTECVVNYPPETAGLGAPVPYSCSTCDSSGSSVSLASEGGRQLYIGNENALRGPSGGQSQIWFRFQDIDEVQSIPAGVYYFSRGFSLTGSNYDWSTSANANAGSIDPALPHLALNQYPLVTLMNDAQMNLQQGGYSWGIGQEHAGAGNRGLKSIWGRYPTWITGTTLTLQGGADSATAGSVYALNGATWNGGGEYYVFGELYTDGNFTLSGTANFYWLYQVRLSTDRPGGFSGVNATQTYIAQ